MTAERDIQRAILIETCDIVRWYRNNVGTAFFKNGAPVKYGVGGPGGSDLIGIVRKKGRFIACEVKIPGWVPHSKADRERWDRQQAFLQGVRDDGGIGIVAICSDDIRDAVGGLKHRRVIIRKGGPVHLCAYPYGETLCGVAVWTAERVNVKINTCKACAAVLAKGAK